MKSLLRLIFAFSVLFVLSSPARSVLAVDGIIPVDQPAPPLVRVLQKTPDKTLGKNESAIEFIFRRPEGGWKGEEIRFAVGKSKEQKVRLGPQGRFVFKAPAGTYTFQFYYDTQHREITSPALILESGQLTQVDVYFAPTNMEIPVDKPVIYVYPRATTPVTLTIAPKALSFAYPEYSNGWSFTADPDGSLHFGNKAYRYLFWDGILDVKVDEVDGNSGFVVKKKDLLGFLETHLSKMGFNAQESQDFITYWYPRMSAKAGDVLSIHFLFNEDCDRYAKMTVDPVPDHVFRVYMMWSKADSSLKLKEQTLPRFDRDGFSILEWGGMES